MDVNVDYNDGRVSQLLHYSYVVRYSTQLDSTRLDSTWGVTFTHLTYFGRMGKLSARFEFIIAFFPFAGA